MVLIVMGKRCCEKGSVALILKQPSVAAGKSTARIPTGLVLPRVIVFPLDGQYHLVQMPFVATPGLMPAQGIGIRFPELQGPLPDSFVGDKNPPAGHHLLDVPKTQRKAKV